MNLRGNLPVSIKRLLKKPGVLPFLILFTLFLLFAGIFAVGQSQDDGSQDTDTGISPSEAGEEDGEFPRIEGPPEWIPPGPPRWFRSNAGGMALEEIPSRLAAIRNEYALVIDYVDPVDLDPFLASFYHDTFSVEIRILFKDKVETRKQWLFKDESGNTRLNAVFRVEVPEPEAVSETPTVKETPALSETEESESEEPDTTALTDTETSGVTPVGETPTCASPTGVSPDVAVIANGVTAADDETAGGDVVTAADGDETADTDTPSPQSPVPTPRPKGPVTIGFVEVYNDDLQISEDYRFTDEGEEIAVAYFYNGNLLVRAETRQRKQNGGAGYKEMYTDNYRYNRSYFLRNIERVFHERLEIEPVVLLFPGRVMEMARDKNFIKDKVVPGIDFIEGFFVGENYRIVYDTDERGRILAQTMFDEKGEEVWVVKNTWVGDRIVSVLKIEGDDKKLTEFEYNGAAERIVQRDIYNGVLERQVLTNGDKETEELFMNGVVVLRAYWENGRKISEERVRRR
jgi:hypothetical protein